MLLALQNLDAKYREPLVAELLSMSRELRRLTPGRMVHIWFIYGSYMVHIWFIYGLRMVYVWFIYGLQMGLERIYILYIYNIYPLYSDDVYI